MSNYLRLNRALIFWRKRAKAEAIKVFAADGFFGDFSIRQMIGGKGKRPICDPAASFEDVTPKLAMLSSDSRSCGSSSSRQFPAVRAPSSSARLDEKTIVSVVRIGVEREFFITLALADIPRLRDFNNWQLLDFNNSEGCGRA